MFHAGSVFRLSTPLDVLRLKALSPVDRVRLGVGVLRARRVRDRESLERRTAVDWLTELFGAEVYRIVWEPLLVGKFGPYAQDVAAVWFWNKLVLRGGSRGRGGEEILAYYRGGFAALARQIAAAIERQGGQILLDSPVDALEVSAGAVRGVRSNGVAIPADFVLATPSLPIVADLIEPHASAEYVASLRKIEYLANVCLVLVLDRSLSGTYWLNVNDPGFPFVGVIEHTNFEPPEAYRGRHIVYLSKYLPASHDMYQFDAPALLAFSLPYLKRMFPAFELSWVLDAYLWRARYAQPIVVRNYPSLIPGHRTPIGGLHLATMAQVYPEDRGTNYAIRDGRAAGARIADLASEARGGRGMDAPTDDPSLPQAANS